MLNIGNTIRNPNIYLSVIVPVFNEEGNVAPLFHNIVSATQSLPGAVEIIFVNDGSADNTLAELKQLSLLTIISLDQNYGQSCSLDAGIKNCQGRFIITMDGDGQNDPRDVPALLSKIEEGFDVVCGWRHQRKDDFLKCLVSYGAALLRIFLVDDGVHDAGCTLRVYKKECFANLDLYGGLHRMIPGLMKWRGFKVTEIKVGHRQRFSGNTKYNLYRIFHGLRDMIDLWRWRKFSTGPLATPRQMRVQYRINEIVRI